MRAVGLTEAGYRRQMQQWLDLSLNKNIPLSFLIMSRAFTFTNFEAKERKSKDQDVQLEPGAAMAAKADAVAMEASTAGTASASAAKTAPQKTAKQARAEEEENEAVAAIASSISAVDEELLTEVLLEKTTRGHDVATEAEAKDRASADGEGERLTLEERTSKVLDKVALRELQLESLRFQNELIEDEAAALEEDKRALEEKKAEKRAAVTAEAVAAADTAAAEEEEQASFPGEESVPLHTAREVAEATVDEAEPELWSVDVERLDEAGIKHDLGKQGKTSVAAAEEKESMAAAASAFSATSTADVKEEDEEQVEAKKATIDEISALEALTHASPVERELKQLKQLKQQKEQLDVAALLAAGRIGHAAPAANPKAPVSRVSKLMEGMLAKIEHDIVAMEDKVGDSLHILDTDNDGEISVAELETAVRRLLRTRVTDEEVQQLVMELDADKDGKVSVAELTNMLDQLREDAGVDEHKALMTSDDVEETDLDLAAPASSFAEPGSSKTP